MLSFTGCSPIHNWYSVTYSILTTPPCTRTLYCYTACKNTNSTWWSQPFYTADNGYKLQLKVYANGEGSGKVSVYMHLMKGPNDDNLHFPINGIFTVQMLNWNEDHHHIEQSIAFDDSIPIEYRERVTRGEIAVVGRGNPQFISHNDVSSMNVLYEDMMCFKISYTPIQTGKQ